MQKPVKLTPYYANYIWGGTKLEESYGKDGGGDIIAESWELSTHKDGGSRIADGKHAGETLEQYLLELEKKTGENPLGTRAKTKNGKLPILIKFIDAREDLSIQVHPGDEYARAHEGDNGKTEMWLILESEPESYLYYGVNKKVTRAEMEEKIKTGRMEAILKKVPVKRGEIYFNPAGTIHSIGKGIVLCEIQQSSNITYRLYDYGRIGKEGDRRPLHIKKGLDVAIMEPQSINMAPEQILDDSQDKQIALLCSCPYFNTYSYKLKNSTVHLPSSKESFITIICMEGSGTIKTHEKSMTFKKGETLFIPACEATHTVNGTCEFLVVTL